MTLTSDSPFKIKAQEIVINRERKKERDWVKYGMDDIKGGGRDREERERWKE